MESIQEHSCNPFAGDACDQCLDQITEWQYEVWSRQMASMMNTLEELEELTNGMHDELAEHMQRLADEVAESEPSNPDPEFPEVPLKKPKKRSRQSKKGDRFISKRVTIVAPNQAAPVGTSTSQEGDTRSTIPDHPGGSPEAKPPFEFRDEDFPPLQ